MKKCLETCRRLNTSCPIEDCRYWIDFDKELNCTFESVRLQGEMTLRETADRLGLSYVRVKQIQDSVLSKISNKFE